MIGWRTKRHLVVIESDDWGSIRMPSREVYDEFLRRGIRVDNDPYCKYDALATKEDLANLFEVLCSVKDQHGNHPVITANTCVANPVFDKIKESGFTEYYYEPFVTTLEKSEAHQGAFDVWKQGMEAGVFHPQLHGREHLSVKKWLKILQEGHPSTQTAFELGTWGLTYLVDPTIDRYYMSAFDSNMDKDIAEYNGIIDDAANLFESIFGYRSKSFIATTYEWSPKIEPALIRNGVEHIQGAISQKIPIDDNKGVKYVYRGFQGTRTKAGLIRLFRNCFFEPSTKPEYDFVDDCLRRIEIAFRYGKAANICAHRLNFIGSIDKANTDKTLPEFQRLLREIVKRWPNVEFVTSDQLGDIIKTSGQYLWKI
jgi:hypothetical protein